MLEKIKTLIGLTDNTKDTLLSILIQQCEDEAVAYTHNDCLAELESTLIQMVIYKYNRLGTEGVSSEGYSGVSYNYTDDYPESILRGLRAKRKVVWK